MNDEEKWSRPVPTHEILNEEFLKPLRMTATALAKAIAVPTNRIPFILKRTRGLIAHARRLRARVAPARSNRSVQSV